MGAAAADFDNDGWPDIYVACDTAPSLLYHNNHDGTFREIAVPAGCAFDENGVALSGMGAGVGDSDGDGWLDIVRTNFTDQVTTLYRNNGDGTFQDASLQAGLGINTKFVGFGVGFLDFDNDGRKDIFIANGHVYPQIAGRKMHLSYRQPRLLYRNSAAADSKTCRPGRDAITTPNLGRGCAFGDLDNDGDIDVVVNNLDGPPSVLRNEGGNSNNWLLVKCMGTKSNRSADRSAGSRGHRRPLPDRRGDERLRILLAERSSAALRPGLRIQDRPGGSEMAVGCTAVHPGRQGESDPPESKRRERDRLARTLGSNFPAPSRARPTLRLQL